MSHRDQNLVFTNNDMPIITTVSTNPINPNQTNPTPPQGNSGEPPNSSSSSDSESDSNSDSMDSSDSSTSSSSDSDDDPVMNFVNKRNNLRGRANANPKPKPKPKIQIKLKAKPKPKPVIRKNVRQSNRIVNKITNKITRGTKRSIVPNQKTAGNKKQKMNDLSAIKARQNNALKDNVRRSARLAEKSKINEPNSDKDSDKESEVSEKLDEMSDVSDSNSGSNSDSESELDEELEAVLQAELDKLNEMDMEFDIPDYDEVRDTLCTEKWFKSLSEDDKTYYVERMMDLQTFQKKLPNVKKIIDLDLDQINSKTLVAGRMNLNLMDKAKPRYDALCAKFLNQYKYLSNPVNKDNLVKLQTVEEELMNHFKFTVPLKERVLMSDFPIDIKSIIYDKYLHASSMDPSDAVKHNTWLETVLSLPHKSNPIKINQTLPQNEAISEALVRIITKLNEKIYGMDQVKDELVCILTNMIENPTSKFKAIGLYGPPGVGKTMIANVIATELGLPMAKIALGGITDSSYLEGHSFTYVGSQPGCIAKSIIKMGCTNGVIYLDEVDKISKTDKGREIEHALLHITDFTQNHDYRDKYMPEIPIDLSGYTFFYSMNSLKQLDPALVSRIPIIKVDGYTKIQKVDILQQYLLPEILRNYDMDMMDVIINNNVATYLISNIREEDETNGKSGVRGLKNVLDQIIKRINVYKLASVDGEMKVKMNFTIDNFKLPYVLTNHLIDQILQDCRGDQLPEHLKFMFM